MRRVKCEGLCHKDIIIQENGRYVMIVASVGLPNEVIVHSSEELRPVSKMITAYSSDERSEWGYIWDKVKRGYRQVYDRRSAFLITTN